MTQNRRTNRILAITLSILVISVSSEIAIKFQADHAVPWSPPSPAGLSELTWIAQQFGFDNTRTIVVVRDTSSYLWSLAYVGGLIYFGNLFYLLTNQTDYSLLNHQDPAIRNAYLGSYQRLWIYGVLSNPDKTDYTILVPSHLYQPDAIERQALTYIGGSVYAVNSITNLELQELFEVWTYSRTSKDILGAARPYLTTVPLADCPMFEEKWASTSGSVTTTVEQGFKTSDCSLRVTAQFDTEATAFAQLRPDARWNLSDEVYVGFYFMGQADAEGQYSFVLLLSTDDDLSSFYSYTISDPGLWDGTVHGILIPTEYFDKSGSPDWSSIVSFNVGVYSSDRGVFRYGLEGLLVAR